MNGHQEPRGLRNCNPLNIRRTADLWQGMSERQPDPEFYTFRSMAWGYRAAFIVLRTYCHKYGVNTIERIVHRWAPPTDNNHTEEYIQKVCILTGFARDVPLNPYNPAHMAPRRGGAHRQRPFLLRCLRRCILCRTGCCHDRRR